MQTGPFQAAPKQPSDTFYAYHERVQGAEGRSFIRDTAAVTPLALLVFGAKPDEVSVQRVKESGRVELPAGFGIRISPEVALLVKLMRRELDQMLLHRVSAPREGMGEVANAVGECVRALLSSGH